MDNEAITPQMVNEIKGVPPEDIAKLSENVIEATKVTNRATEELKHLSNCLADFTQTHDEYQKKASQVRNQMRYLSSHM